MTRPVSTLETASRGFTLVEVLIAVVILSVGMLGLMGLQTVALRQNSSSQTRTYAVEFINELADRMRANRLGVNANRYALQPNQQPSVPAYDCINSFPGQGTNCNPQEIAEVDLFAWKTSADSVFPGSQAAVTCTDSEDPGFADNNNDSINDADTDGDVCTDGSLFLISLSWNDDRSANSTPVNFQVTFIP